MTQNRPTAKEIATDLLERSGVGLLTNDFDLFAKCFWLPQELHTFEGLQVLTTLDEMERVFNKVRAFHLQEGVTDMVRHTVEAAFIDESTISAVHETRLVRGTYLIKKPYPVLSKICCIDGEWRVSRGDYAIDDSPVLAAALGSDVSFELQTRKGPKNEPFSNEL